MVKAGRKVRGRARASRTGSTVAGAVSVAPPIAPATESDRRPRPVLPHDLLTPTGALSSGPPLVTPLACVYPARLDLQPPPCPSTPRRRSSTLSSRSSLLSTYPAQSLPLVTSQMALRCLRSYPSCKSSQVLRFIDQRLILRLSATRSTSASLGGPQRSPRTTGSCCSAR